MEATYQEFLEQKIKLAVKTGFEIDPSVLHPILKPHQRDVIVWNILGGCRADFLSFGLGKTMIQLETLRQIHNHKGGNVLIVCPLGVKHEFVRDGRKLDIDRIKYITNTGELEAGQYFYITNYERIRRGSIDPSMFTAVTFDEASILRSLDTDTTQTILETFAQVPYRFVCTATPSPNRYLELINYSEYLGIMDRGQALTRFFKRDSTTAGNLTLYSRREKEFWYWMSSWAVFITKPSDLGYDNAGYDLPGLTIIPHRISFEREVVVDKQTGQSSFVADSSKSLIDGAREKRQSMPYRLAKAFEVIAENQDDNWLIWHTLDDEQHAIQKQLGKPCVSVYGTQDLDQREEYLLGFSEGKYQYLSTKPKIAGSGCNFQHYCHKAFFVGIDYKFNDFIQAIHRVYRFLQDQQVEIHVCYTDAEDDVYKVLMQKWENHRNLQNQMTDIIKKFGLNSDLYQSELSREMFTGRREMKGQNWTYVNNDAVDEWRKLEDNSLDLIVTSIPFGNHYEYSENYNCFGHNETNEAFFKQMDYLVPELYRTLKPGRIAAIHVKDRIRYSYMNGTGFSSIDPFSDETTACFRKHGFHLMSRITIDTDVVRENNGTYRLSWTEACKDMTKMGCGLPEYVLVLRKAPTLNKNAYADEKVVHAKKEFIDGQWTGWYYIEEECVGGYSVGRWQLDAHAHWKSSGAKLVSTDQLKRLDFKNITKLWKELDKTGRYDYHKHVELADRLEEVGKLSKEFMMIPPQSNHPDIWDDITRMRTLNTDQVKGRAEKHICPLQLDIIERLIERYSNPGEIVADPFSGIGSVPFQAVKMGRIGFGTELNTVYWKDGNKHLKGAEAKHGALTLFDFAT